MRARALAALLALAALGVHFGLTATYRARAERAADEYRRVRDERRQITSRVAQAVRLQDAQRRARRLPAAGIELTPARAARLQVVRSLEGSGIQRVRLGVAPGRLAASVRLTGEGSFDDVVRFAGEVVRPGSGLLLRQVALQAKAEAVGLTLEADGVGNP